jgi:hypothetical protein
METQEAILSRILRQNAATAYGREHDFGTIRNIGTFQQRVPLVTYDDLWPFIEEAARGKRDVLVPGLPRCFQPTSGSTSATKLIPCTPALHDEFQAGIAPWIYDAFSHHPGMLRGRAYWSISPIVRRDERTEGGIPVGFATDTDYLGSAIQRLAEQVMAVPQQAMEIGDPEGVRYVTLAFLLKARDLGVISIWNPTFLSLLLAPLRRWTPSLARDLERGQLAPPGDISPGLQKQLSRRLGSNRSRAREVERILQEGDREGKTVYERLWPDLAFISCWMHGFARGPAMELKKQFPNVRFVPKGLVATEGLVSFPLEGVEGSTLSLGSHFFEFIQQDKGNGALTAGELKEGERYSVVLTTGGGLYRYRLGDIVQVVGFLHRCPLIEFVGRGDSTCDLYGEKLHEAHVVGILEGAVARLRSPPAFRLLAPEGPGIGDHYTLFLAGDGCPEAGELAKTRLQLDRGLCRNVHYQYCRQLGQLKEADVCWIEGGAQRAFQRYHERRLAEGQKAGDIKSAVLDCRTNWRRTLVADPSITPC